MGVAVGLALACRVVAPLLKATRAAEDVAVGDLARTIVAEGDDETASLLRSFAEMQSSLRTLVSSGRDNASGVERASAEIAQGHRDLSQRTGDQAAALQVTASTMKQFGAKAVGVRRLGCPVAELLGRELGARFADLCRWRFAPQGRAAAAARGTGDPSRNGEGRKC